MISLQIALLILQIINSPFTVEEGVRHIEELAQSSSQETDVLITGSLHLIGASLQVLHPTFLEDGMGGGNQEGAQKANSAWLVTSSEDEPDNI